MSIRTLKKGQFLGSTRRIHQYPGVILSEIFYDGGQKAPRHRHELSYFALLLEGGYTERSGRRLNAYSPFTVAYHPQGETHWGAVDPCGSRCFHIEIEKPLLERLRECSPLPGPTADLHGGALVWLASRIHREHQSHDTLSPLVIEGLILELLAATARLSEQSRPPSWLRRVEEILHEEFHLPLTVADVARRAGIHPVHLSRVARQHWNQTLGERLRELRIRHSCGILAQSDCPLAEIALQVGFADQSQFTKAFKKVVGSTPGIFRKRLLWR